MDLLEQIRAIWSRLGSRQRITLGAGAAFTVVVAIALSTWAARPRLELLYGGLAAEDAARIVEVLKSEKVLYRLGEGGAAVLVPRDQVYELRLKLASLGIPRRGSVGYEIFDKNTLGMTDFVQRLNYQRALEGELTRTLEQLAEVEQARIHIVLPEQSLFTEDAKQPSASVVVRVAAGHSLGPRQVQGIRQLVAAGVEGLKPEGVTVVDAEGNILTRDTQGDGGLVSGDRLELKRSVEGYLAGKASSMLDGVLGHGTALVQVDADLDFDRVEKTIETYDGDNPVVRSEERTTQSGAAGSGQGESTITNYEISRTVERVVGGVANIKRLSVAVLVDGTYAEEAGPGGDQVRVYRPRAGEELTRLTTIIENAVGAVASRGDRVTVENFAFDRRPLDQVDGDAARRHRTQFLIQVANRVGVGLLVILLALLARNFLREVRGILSGRATTPEAEAEYAAIEPREITLIQMQSQILALAQENPQRMADLVRVWVREPVLAPTGAAAPRRPEEAGHGHGQA